MLQNKRWKVDIFIDDHDGRTYAEARLIPQDQPTLITTGEARMTSWDTDVPEIGEELAVARALSELAHRLLEAAMSDIEAITDKDVGLPA